MDATLIQAPLDFLTVIPYHDFAVWNLTHPPLGVDQRAMSQIEQIFTDLSSLEAGNQAHLTEFIDAVALPLNRLNELGCVILATISRGIMLLDGGAEVPNWVRTHFFVVPIAGAFRVGDDLTVKVHRFEPRCLAAMLSLKLAARDGLSVTSWNDDRAIMRDYEGTAPWCPTCRELYDTRA